MKKIQKACMMTVLAVIIFMFLFICARIVTGEVFVKKLALSGPVIDIILFDVDNLNNGGENAAGKATSAEGSSEEKSATNITPNINWAQLYPFPEETVSADSADAAEKKSRLSPVFSEFNDIVDKIKKEIETYCTDYLPWYKPITVAAKKTEQLLQWNFVDFDEYNGAVRLFDGLLTDYIEKRDVSACAESLKALHNYSIDCGADFIYIQAPYKICQYEDDGVSGSLDFSNQNANALLAAVSDMNIDHLDLRELIHQEGLNHHSMFYRTDHHWKAESGFWAAKHLLTLLHEKYGFDVETGLLEENLFTKECYKNWFLGSKGKKVTLAQTTPDDFTIYYPNFETSFHYVIPNKQIDTLGDFSVTYDMSQVEKLDYYNKNPYAAYNHSDKPLIQISNLLSSNNTKVLIVHDSFSNCVIPFLALGVNRVDAIDLRHFTGSLEAYIKETKPEIVIVMYNPNAISQSIDWTKHNSLFDFR